MTLLYKCVASCPDVITCLFFEMKRDWSIRRTIKIVLVAIVTVIIDHVLSEKDLLIFSFCK